jgi:hypothetical protein
VCSALGMHYLSEDVRAHACKVVINIGQLTISAHLCTRAHTLVVTCVHTRVRRPVTRHCSRGSQWAQSSAVFPKNGSRGKGRNEISIMLHTNTGRGWLHMGVPSIGRMRLEQIRVSYGVVYAIRYWVERQDRKLIDIAQDVGNLFRQWAIGRIRRRTVVF